MTILESMPSIRTPTVVTVRTIHLYCTSNHLLKSELLQGFIESISKRNSVELTGLRIVFNLPDNLQFSFLIEMTREDMWAPNDFITQVMLLKRIRSNQANLLIGVRPLTSIDRKNPIARTGSMGLPLMTYFRLGAGLLE
jgi:hypothetical protein